MPLPRGLIVLLALVAGAGVVAAMQGFAEILGPVFLALMLTVAVNPLTGVLHRRGLPLWLAVTITVLVVVGLVLGLAVSLAVSIGELATLMPTYGDQFAALVDQLTTFLAGLGVGPDQVRTALSKLDFGAVAGVFAGLLAGLATALSNLFFIVALLLFMGVDAAQFPARLRAIMPERPEVVAAFRSFASGTRSYLVVSTVFGAIVAVVDAGVLWWFGIPLPLLWGLLAFITNYIPNIGFVIGLVPPALLALLEGGPRLMVIVIVAYSVINFVIQSVIQPKFVGDAVDLSLTLTFLSLVFWTWVLGGLGALLAIPLTLLAKALLLDVDPSARWMTVLITGGAPPVRPDPAVPPAPPIPQDPAPSPTDELAGEPVPVAPATAPPEDGRAPADR